MKSWYERIVEAHLQVTDAVSHAQRMQSERYFVWQEDGRDDLSADNGHAEIAVTGSTDLFTKVEFDPWAKALEEALSEAGIAWELVDVVLENDTGFWHYSLDWTVIG